MATALATCSPAAGRAIVLFQRQKAKENLPAPVKLQRDGKEINLGSAATVFAADWRGTGRLDLLVGNIEGDIYLLANDGSNTQPAYSSPGNWRSDGQPIKATQGDSQPVVADWDGDGLLDLIVGCGDGSVMWYRNVGTKTKPQLAKGVALVKASPSPQFTMRHPLCGSAFVCQSQRDSSTHRDTERPKAITPPSTMIARPTIRLNASECHHISS